MSDVAGRERDNNTGNRNNDDDNNSSPTHPSDLLVAESPVSGAGPAAPPRMTKPPALAGLKKNNSLIYQENGIAKDPRISQFIQDLDEHRKQCEKDGKYVEALIAKKRLDEVRLHELERQREALHAKQAAEKLGVDQAQKLEFEKFNRTWDDKMTQFEEHAVQLEAAMRQRHTIELEEHLSAFSDPSTMRVHYSRELLNLRKVQETLAKRQDYLGAQRLKVKADELEAAETAKMKERREKSLTNKKGMLKHHHHNELEALRKRIDTNRQELRKQRAKAMERLVQRYHNIKKELEYHHSLENKTVERRTASIKNRADSFVNPDEIAAVRETAVAPETIERPRASSMPARARRQSKAVARPREPATHQPWFSSPETPGSARRHQDQADPGTGGGGAGPSGPATGASKVPYSIYASGRAPSRSGRKRSGTMNSARSTPRSEYSSDATSVPYSPSSGYYEQLYGRSPRTRHG